MHLRRHPILKPAKDIGKLCEENYTKDIKDDQKKKRLRGASLVVWGTRICNPWSGRILHAAGQLGWTPQLLKPECPNLCSATGEAAATRSLRTATREQPPPASTRESPSAAMKTQHSHKQIIF